jgi:hypothetical protein
MARNLALFLAAVELVADLKPATRDDGYVAEVDDHPLAIEPRKSRRLISAHCRAGKTSLAQALWGQEML